MDLGLKWVVLGHSERRALIGESSEFIADKTAYALSKGLSVILCCGETLAEREANQTFAVVASQLSAVADKVKDWTNIGASARWTLRLLWWPSCPPAQPPLLSSRRVHPRFS